MDPVHDVLFWGTAGVLIVWLLLSGYVIWGAWLRGDRGKKEEDEHGDRNDDFRVE